MSELELTRDEALVLGDLAHGLERGESIRVIRDTGGIAHVFRDGTYALRLTPGDGPVSEPGSFKVPIDAEALRELTDRNLLAGLERADEEELAELYRREVIARIMLEPSHAGVTHRAELTAALAPFRAALERSEPGQARRSTTFTRHGDRVHTYEGQFAYEDAGLLAAKLNRDAAPKRAAS